VLDLVIGGNRFETWDVVARGGDSKLCVTRGGA
jgi:hypothetical protein